MSSTYDMMTEESGLEKLGRNWGLVLTLGILTFIVGLLMVIFTKQSVFVLAVFFGIYLFVSGIFQLVQSFAVKEHRALLAISGILSIILGVFAFKSLQNSFELLVIFIGIAWLFRGITELVVGLQAKGMQGRGWMITGGILGIIGSIVIFVWPAASIGVIVWVSGIFFMVLGISEIVGAFSLKKAADA
jgi:uncharacterized membrane protein HdeD (DUF308 family)